MRIFLRKGLHNLLLLTLMTLIRRHCEMYPLELKTSKEENAPRKSQEKSCFLKNDSQYTHTEIWLHFFSYFQSYAKSRFFMKMWNVSLELKTWTKENIKKNLVLKMFHSKSTSKIQAQIVGNEQKVKQIRTYGSDC